MKKPILAVTLALALACSSFLGFLPGKGTMTVQAAEAAAPGSSPKSSEDSAEEVQLQAPANLEWGSYWGSWWTENDLLARSCPRFDIVPDAKGYEVEVYFNGKLCSTGTTTNSAAQDGHIMASCVGIICGWVSDRNTGEPFHDDFSLFGPWEEGKYTFRVRAYSGNKENYSEWAYSGEGDNTREAFLAARGENNAESGSEDSGSSAGESDEEKITESYEEDFKDMVEAAQSGSTVEIRGVTTISNDLMRELKERGDVALRMEYSYEGVDYVIVIPAGQAVVTEDIYWYGPLWLAQHYGNGAASSKAAAGSSYTVQPGDTFGKVARNNGMTIAELAAKNPQVKDVNKILSGESLNLQ